MQCSTIIYANQKYISQIKISGLHMVLYLGNTSASMRRHPSQYRSYDGQFGFLYLPFEMDYFAPQARLLTCTPTYPTRSRRCPRRLPRFPSGRTDPAGVCQKTNGWATWPIAVGILADFLGLAPASNCLRPH